MVCVDSRSLEGCSIRRLQSVIKIEEETVSLRAGSETLVICQRSSSIMCSVALSYYLLTQRRELVRDKRVLEVACRSGLAGIAASHAGAKKVTLLVPPEGYDAVRRGVRASNAPHTELALLRCGQKVREDYDVVLVSDAILSDACVEPLVAILESCLLGRAHHPFAIVAWQRRNAMRERRILEALRGKFDISVMADLPDLPPDALTVSTKEAVAPLLASSSRIFLRVEPMGSAPGHDRFSFEEGMPLTYRHFSL
ncbi:hypothetical protein CTAYLR_006556 [Chrysophaeum taylorii]|uniref:Uncharacterized protein n=1 Tax=Chrysophaeum taylorii TaxID=2483200 RepID=A0AAD7UFI3_9STRA|nr:hypothetical protein CTAYLR_006556 [Chrysophaeum taylorii]